MELWCNRIYNLNNILYILSATLAPKKKMALVLFPDKAPQNKTLL